MRRKAPTSTATTSPPDYRRSIGDARVDKIVHVSAVVGTQRYLDELRWVDGVAEGSGFEVRCVGSVDPTLGATELAPHFDAQLEGRRLRGAGCSPASSPTLRRPAPSLTG